MLTGLVFVFCGSGMIRFDNAIQWMQLSMKNEELLRNLVSVKWQESLRPSAAYLCMQSRCTVGGTLLTFPSSKCWMHFLPVGFNMHLIAFDLVFHCVSGLLGPSL